MTPNLPATADELDYPIEREIEAREKTTTFEVDTRLFHPRPFKDKEKAENKLFFLAFNYNQFAWFKGWPALRWYYLKLSIHRVNVVTDSGRVRQQQVICEASMNRFATEKLSTNERVIPAPFLDERTGRPIGYCAFCKRSQELWDTYRDQKKAAGIEGVTEDRFKQMMEQHPEIKKTRDLAREWGASDRYFFIVFDYSRLLGEVELEADDDGTCALQAWIGPQKIVDELYKKQKAKYKFWDFASNSARAVIVTRDNKRSRIFCEYSVEVENDSPQLDGPTTAYLQAAPAEDLAALDPANFIVQMTNLEKKNYVAAYGEGSPTPRDDGDAGVSRMGDDPDGPQVAEAPAAEVQSAPAARPKARISAPSAPATPPPSTTATAAKAAPASAEPPPPPAQEAPPAPSAEAAAKRVKVTWRPK